MKTYNRRRILVYATSIVFMLVLLAGIVEGGSMLVIHFKNDIRILLDGSQFFDPYEISSPDQNNLWLLKPGYEATLEEYIENKRRSGKILAVKQLERISNLPGVSNDTTLLRINSKGFKGDEIRETANGLRILCLGDSVTFGLLHTYPKALENNLREQGYSDVQVINGGVEGYGPKQLMYRIEDYKELQPDITIIFIGWNALFQDNPKRTLNSLILAREIWDTASGIFDNNNQNKALSLLQKEKKVDINAPEVLNLESYTPSFLNEIENIVEEMRSSGSKLVIMTLPGLFVTDEEPTPKALTAGHLPYFSNNPYVLATMAERYNSSLREIALKEEVTLIDLEKWSYSNLQPRDEYFFDSVHLYGDGLTRIGNFVAGELTHIIDQ